MHTPVARNWFAKGEATANDFVVMLDLSGGPGPSAGFVQALCDRRRGLGGDGLLRIAAADAGGPARFFMDYRNADGTLAEMCGNGARVFAVALRELGLETSEEFTILTRGGPRSVRCNADGTVSIGMGAPRFAPSPDLTCASAAGPGRAVWMPNPHAVFHLDDPEELAGLDLSAPPVVLPAATFPDGVNVEFVTDVADHHIRMRVHERGVGETMSCGTGACAAAVACALDRGESAGGSPWRVDVPGGSLRVSWLVDDLYLSGPANIVGTGHLDDRWEAANG